MEILVATAREVDDHDVVGMETFFVEHGECVCAFESRDYSLVAGECHGCVESLGVGDGENFRAALGGEIGMERPDAGIVEPGRNRVRLYNLSVGGLHHECP